MKTTYSELLAFITKDGSTIRELMHPLVHASRNLSLAEAIVPPGVSTQLHRHRTSEELYHVTVGYGRMVLGERTFEVVPGDSVVIAPGTPHRIENIGDVPLRILCACAPAYSHEDTELV